VFRTILYPPPRVRKPAPPRWGLAFLLLVITFFTTTTLGSIWMLVASTEKAVEDVVRMVPATVPLLPTFGTIVRIWTDPSVLGPGLAFSLASLFILLCHELGHYLACRYYKLPSTLPYFLPAPIALGTFGAFIRIRAAIRSKKELFDVGVAGPIAGFVALMPVLILGFLWSGPVPASSLPPVPEAPPGQAIPQLLIAPGDSLATLALSEAFHDDLGPDEVLRLHPFVFAGWFGLLATALNLIPLGQLDGGHILYAVFGRGQRRLALPLWLTLLAVAIWIWPAWLLWCGITLVMGLFHPPVRDETTPLDKKRLGVAVLALAIFALSFMPVPIREIVVVDGARLEEGAPPEPPPAPQGLTVDSRSHAPTNPAPGR
jgi:membrane-associated protease RseP (regulator of RpoE activity)